MIEEAIEAAKENVKLNNIDNIEFIVGDVGEKLKEIEEKPDLIIIDPPRPGVGPKALQQIIGMQVLLNLPKLCQVMIKQRLMN
ncbi:MAG: methyltransferase domain-containing protein [Clostridiales bacterium]|nr:methyltransferase domain-containing protein [Clostridiales bacterium]